MSPRAGTIYGPRRSAHLGQQHQRQEDVLRDAVDRFTLGHVALGVLYGLGRFPWWLAVGLAVGWELIEDPLKQAVPEMFPTPYPESTANHLVDVLANLFGYTMIRALFPRPAPGERF